MNLDKSLDMLADYADLVWSSTDLQDKNTMDVAHAQQELFESGEWVAEWLEQKPRPQRSSNRFDPASRNRFAQWLAWKQEQRGRRSYAGRRVYQFADAVEVERVVVSKLNGVQIRSEFQLRPLVWLKRYNYLDRAPEVLERAIEKVGSADQITGTAVRAALNEYKSEVITPKGVRQLQKRSKAQMVATAVVGKFHELVELAREDQTAADELRRVLGVLDAELDKAGWSA